jgi:hypothetical protein
MEIDGRLRHIGFYDSQYLGYVYTVVSLLEG